MMEQIRVGLLWVQTPRRSGWRKASQLHKGKLPSPEGVGQAWRGKWAVACCPDPSHPPTPGKN